MKLYKNLQVALKERSSVEAIKISVKEAEFPQDLLHFSDLKELYLEGNCEHFVKETPGWSKLNVLSIKWPKFTGDLSSLFSLSNLENLKIIETPLKQFLLPLGMAVAPIKSLTIKDSALKLLPEELSMLEGLEELNLSGNELEKLPASFSELRKLKRLNLDNNKFSLFPDLIKKMPSLKHLSIDGNYFSEDEKARIQREFHIWVA